MRRVFVHRLVHDARRLACASMVGNQRLRANCTLRSQSVNFLVAATVDATAASRIPLSGRLPSDRLHACLVWLPVALASLIRIALGTQRQSAHGRDFAMPLHGYVILIVEPDVTPFVSELQDAIERDRGESIAVRDTAAALACCAKFQFSAALVNTDRHDMVGKLMMPVVLYQPQEGHRSVLARLKMLLSATGPRR